MSHAYSLFESETLTPESLGGREFLRDFVLCISFFLLALSFRLSLESSKSDFQVNGNPFLLNSLEYKLDERVL